MRIYVSGIRGDTIALDDVTGTVESVKSKITEVEGIAADQQYLQYCREEMQSGRALAKYNVKDGSTVQLYMLGWSGSYCKYGGSLRQLANKHNLDKMICRKCYCRLPAQATRCRHAKCGRTSNIRPKKRSMW